MRAGSNQRLPSHEPAVPPATAAMASRIANGGKLVTPYVVSGCGYNPANGGVTIVVARFLPFLRTFAPFVAGVAQMTRSKFTMYDVAGGVLWVGGVTLAGYLFGNIPWVKSNLEKIIWALILVPSALAIFGSWKASRAPQS